MWKWFDISERKYELFEKKIIYLKHVKIMRFFKGNTRIKKKKKLFKAGKNNARFCKGNTRIIWKI